ncbi:hypothetical protein [Nocardiopsis sp. NPDC057823]|uniref:hypothetical protein n=1 Tax=Nocardiopsis sp. NPDC057823 TaxID=3346256 RepID=UPI00366D0525
MTATTQRPAFAPGLSPWVRALLLAVLLAAFGAMHTLGHADHGDRGHGAAHAAPAAQAAHGAHPAPAAHTAPVAHTLSGAHVEPVLETASSALPELDPTSVCPTLAGPGLPWAGLAATAFTPWPGPPAPAAATGALRGDDPPSVAAGKRPVLSDLQVFRI